MPARTAAPSATPSARSALHRPIQSSAELAAVIGPGPVTRAEATSRLWGYIRDHQCQNPENKREILADAKLKPVLGGAASATMFEVPKHLNRHLT